MNIKKINGAIPGGPLLEIEIDADVSNIVDFPYTIDITPINEIGKSSPNRIQNLNKCLNDLGINDDEIRSTITEQVEEFHVNIISFYLG